MNSAKCLNSAAHPLKCALVFSSALLFSPVRAHDGRQLGRGVIQTMAKITFIQPDGTSQTVNTEPGLTVMEAAKINNVAGIEAECGGACACATCHVFVDEAWRAATGKPAEMEEDMLDFAFDVREGSRLCCQIKVTAALDGLIVRVPAKQF
jgi:ferredoxin, 2Fe-2S